ncbi:RagB/SusD family nutrient uptake outer membrane protein [Chitinophaga sedimenti]|uniref:RagB/SusD family nutrient uptake outer membrane protein n=1 Tax=Chitinophaga sedimenti TaxID=2033606 RepID=UPI0020048186|nr:RagB/SusD family nutrient uptake outer membrane protein [Chitinophaga sedimenti]MCK7556324.1 RagB/SusD family nutrient uptake outer membrane protein [Chitinophaga sedimenti]
MKKIFLSTILIGALTGSGCNKWLDVKPVAQTTKDELFQTQKGFRDALTGAYIHLKDNKAYGNSLMWGNIEYMARNWEVASSSNVPLMNLANANYTDATVRGWLDGSYEQLYKIVADANSILEKIDAKQSIFTDNNYALIKGEALILRAFAHFDALRMYGPLPGAPGTTAVLPYVKAVSSQIVEPVTFQQFVLEVIADLDAAEALLKTTDPLTKYSLTELNPPASSSLPPVLDDDFYMYRQIRFNYYSALALKARVYTWMGLTDEGNRANAAKYAQMVIDAKDRTGQPTFRLGRESDRASGDFTMSPEHIAALHIYNLNDVANGAFGETGSLMRYDLNVTDGYYYLNNLFPVSERGSDVRWLGMWAYKTTANMTNYVAYKKYIQRPNENQRVLQVPLLRLSEMYLVLTEAAKTKEEAETWYRAFAAQKGVPFTTGFSTTGWENDRKNKIIREYVREFYAEGQTFYTYKRFNVTTLPASWTYTYYSATAARYLVPKPDREINYHNN